MLFRSLILDGSMPEMDGFEVCKKVREFSHIPIIFLSGRVDESDKILGLESGADDYVTKPFSSKELIARIKTQARRLSQFKNKDTNQSLQGDFVVDSNQYKVLYKGSEVNLTSTEFEIFNYLFTNVSVVKSREEIMQGVHGDSWEAFDRALDISISRIRKKIKEVSGLDEVIKTVRLKGYMFVKQD